MNTATNPESVQPAHVLEDPRAQRIANVYANAFLDAAGAAGDVNGLLEEFQSFVELLNGNPQFKELLYSGMIPKEEKIAIIERVIAPRGSKTFTNFLWVLAEHGRKDLLQEILAEALLEHEKRSGKERVKITSAQPLSEAQLEEIRQGLAKQLPFDPILIPKVDPKLIGGIVIRIGDTVYDSSLRSRLKGLRERLRERSLNEIQSGRDRFCHSEGN
ncbi:MAG: ATP synthase F1 subunit delta [Planctomycetales bacterium]